MNTTDIAWAAGLLEGEGSFIWRKTNSPKISCAMTDKDIIDRLHSLFGGYICETTKAQDHWKDAWIWYIHGSDAIEIMKKILPYMGIRRSSKIAEVIKFYEFYIEQKESKELESLRVKVAAAYEYKTTNDSLRVVASRHGISHVTLKNFLDKESDLIILA